MTYNNEEFIEETLQSIFKQNTDFSYEIVVGDDCSTDNTLSIINKYSKKHPNLFAIEKNPNQLGILKNFKATLDRCNGKYIFDIAGDDIIKTEDALQKIMNVFRANPTLGFVDSGYDKFLVSSNKCISFINKNTITIDNEKYRDSIFLGKVIPVGVCYNKEALYKYVDFDFFIQKNITIEDYPILVSLVSNCEFGRVDESLHEYRLHLESYTQTPSFERAHFLRNQMLELFNFFKTKYNFSEKLNRIFLENHNKSLLFLSGVYQNKSVGRETYKSIKNKSLRDFIHYLASQYPLVRSIIKLRKKLLFKAL
ncbi:MAG: glycosyltransferase [Winogradskyella sp.]|nr:glycosyltransferase [Winogradskyella sp.]